MNSNETAHLAWNALWQTAEARARWEVPAAEVVALAEELRRRGRFRKVLDLGCGVGRHALLYARLGFDVAATDLAPAGIAELERKAAQEGLAIATHIAPATALPIPDASIDLVLAFNVIYHGDRQSVVAALAEIRRVLRPGGLLQATMLSRRNALYGKGTEVAPDTFVTDDGQDKMHPHFYCGSAGLVELLQGFELVSLQDQDHSEGRWHWHLLAERIAAPSPAAA